ncbi:lipopolysaccharide transport periplasmic protein LptA [Undibacterium sp.]|uniref:lipopolysaccharide transport periplasmic protein LptA n=1 Tax=Undibacterium sp. TaxID=1914977 RepID=UPI0025DD090E|nr:lipopolysaccharide transport periplasmic protein LptA [Undibacterium sp.]
MYAIRNSGLSYLGQLTISLCFLAPVACAHAEKADSQKETNIEAELSNSDGKKNVTTLTGDVILTRGTLIVKSDRAVITQTADEHMNVVLTSKPGKQNFFRQKRDGGDDLWVEGVADRIEYDDKTELVRFISKARVKYLEGKKVTQEQEGEFLSYDSLNDVFVATNSINGTHVPGAGRVKLTLQPKLAKPVNLITPIQ